MKMIKKVRLIILFEFMFLLSSSCSTNKIDSNNMFTDNVESYTGQSVSKLILSSKFSLNDIRVSSGDRGLYVDYLKLYYSNGVNLKVTLDSSDYLRKMNTCLEWDYNKLIKEKINKIEILDFGVKKNDSIQVKVLYSTVDSLFIDRIMIMENGYRLSIDSLYKASCLKK